MVQGHHHADHGVQGGEAVADRDAGPGRRPVGLAGDMAQAAHGLADQAVARPLRIGSRLAEARHPGHHQPRIAGGQDLVAHAPFLHGAGAEVLDQDVGLVDQGQGQFPALRLAQVEGHRALVAPDHRPPGRQALGQGPAPLAHGIALAGVLDLDHVGAEVAQHLAAEGPGDECAHLHDLQVGQGPLGGLVGHGALRFRRADLGRRPEAVSIAGSPRGFPRPPPGVLPSHDPLHPCAAAAGAGPRRGIRRPLPRPSRAVRRPELRRPPARDGRRRPGPALLLRQAR